LVYIHWEGDDDGELEEEEEEDGTPPSLSPFLMAVFLGVVRLCRSDMVEETSKKKSEIGFAAGELNLVLVRRKWRWSIRSSR
jgi:hypothetical protein